MDAIELMTEEHANIRRLLKVARKACIDLLDGNNINYDNFYKMIDFIRNYADKHHHGKEEVILFKKMGDELGERISKGPVAGMLIEHDLGRLFVSNLEAALEKVKNGDKDSRVDVIANTIGYADLLNRHIDKENTAIYSFARRALKKETMEEIDERCETVENEAIEKGVQQKYLNILNELEKEILK